jgi:DNA-binding XRE family transcriptional regulator
MIANSAKYSNLEYSRCVYTIVLNMADDDIVKRIGLNITVIREQRGLTQEKLAELAGLHRAYIGQIERGEKNIGLRNLEKIAKALNVDIRVLVDTSKVDC